MHAFPSPLPYTRFRSLQGIRRGNLLMQRRLGPFVFAIVVFSLLAASCEKLDGKQGSALQPNSPRPTIVFMTDFTHQVTPYQIEEGARFLAAVAPYYPSGTVFLAVVDPGVGTSRKAVIVKTKKGQYFVLPDNGLITPFLDRGGLDSAHEITNTTWMLTPAVSSTFHGRDIFSPAAAHLAAGWDYTIAGP